MVFIFSSPGQDCSSGPTDYAGNFCQSDWMSSFCAIVTGFVRVVKKPGKSWIFIVSFSRTGKSWKKATDPAKFWKSVKLK